MTQGEGGSVIDMHTLACDIARDIESRRLDVSQTFMISNRKMPTRNAIVSYWNDRLNQYGRTYDDQICWQCKQPCGRLDRAHVVPHTLGGPDIVENIWLLCPTCHFNTEATTTWHKTHALLDDHKFLTYWRGFAMYESNLSRCIFGLVCGLVNREISLLAEAKLFLLNYVAIQCNVDGTYRSTNAFLDIHQRFDDALRIAMPSIDIESANKATTFDMTMQETNRRHNKESRRLMKEARIRGDMMRAKEAE